MSENEMPEGKEEKEPSPCKDYILYVHLFPDHTSYVGITRQDAKKRWRNGEGYRNNPQMYAAIKKYGWENVISLILCGDMTAEEASAMEQLVIQKFGSFSARGHNRTKGGFGVSGYVPTSAHRSKTSETLKAYYARHPEALESIRSKATGRKQSEETKKKISESLKAITDNEEYRQKRRNAMNAKPVLLMERKLLFDSIACASQITGICRGHISEACRGKRQKAGPFHWRYYSGGQLSATVWPYFIHDPAVPEVDFFFRIPPSACRENAYTEEK